MLSLQSVSYTITRRVVMHTWPVVDHVLCVLHSLCSIAQVYLPWGLLSQIVCMRYTSKIVGSGLNASSNLRKL